MDIEEWELLPDDGFLGIHDDGSGNKFYSRKYVNQPNKNIFQMNNYLNISPQSSQSFNFDPPPPEINQHPKQVVPNQLVSIPIQLQHHKSSDDKLPIELDFVVPAPPSVTTTDDMANKSPSSYQDSVSQVFFKKENEFVDMKMDSPRSTACTNNGIMMDLGMRKEDVVVSWEELGKEENGVGGFNLWKWSVNRVGAICSFGVAAATICIIVFANHKSKNQHNEKLRFQIYTDDKGMKQEVQHATKLNKAISVARGMPLTRAHITVGGNYDGL